MPRDREAVRPQGPPVEGAIPGIQETRLRTYIRPYLYAKVYFNIIIYYTIQGEAQHKDRCENNSRQDGEGEKRTTPTSQVHVPGSTNILDVPTESYIVT